MRRALLTLLVAVILTAACGDDDSGPYHPAGVGNYCEVDEDCPTGTCYLGPGGGYCTAPCADEGDTSECPVDTVCKPIQGGPRRCLLICGSESSCDADECALDFCPFGSSCVDVSDTSLRGCEPVP